MIAPAPAPSTPPPSVPFSRVDKGCPLHPASVRAATSTRAIVANTLLFEFLEYFIASSQGDSRHAIVLGRTVTLFPAAV
jgi:hypothetical protein